MSKKPTGGPAFPFERIKQRVGGQVTEWENSNGMTLRDYFAAKALAIASEGYKQIGCEFVATEDYLDAAKAAYKMADAMLEARES